MKKEVEEKTTSCPWLQLLSHVSCLLLSVCCVSHLRIYTGIQAG